MAAYKDPEQEVAGFLQLFLITIFFGFFYIFSMYMKNGTMGPASVGAAVHCRGCFLSW